MREFSIVVPVAGRDLRLLPKTLSSWLSLGSDDIVICADKPAPVEIVNKIIEIAKELKVENNVRILEVEKNLEYKFHQAWVRRSGFRAAKHDVILTGDIDLEVYPICLKAIELVGKDDVGLVSLSKIRYRQGFVGKLRYYLEKQGKFYARKVGKKQAYFTGLYALYRPFWLDSEDEAGLKNLINPYYSPLIVGSWGGYMGEDTHLRDCMIKKHKVAYLPDIGSEEFQGGLEERKDVQLRIGTKFAVEGKTPVDVIRHSMFTVRLHVFTSYFDNICEVYGRTGAIAHVIFSLVEFPVYVATRVSLRLIMGKQKRNSILPNIFKHRFNLDPMDDLTLEKILKLCRHEFLASIIAKRVKGDLFVDVGANSGYYSLLLRNNFKKIVAFEPSREVCEDLEKNIRDFNATNVQVVNKAVSNSDEVADRSIAKYPNFMVKVQQLVLDPDAQKRVADSIPVDNTHVEHVSLSSYFKDAEKIDLIKVDTEGGEWGVLEGAEGIMINIQRWIVELYTIDRSDELENWFKTRGYKIKWLSFNPEKTIQIYAWREENS